MAREKKNTVGEEEEVDDVRSREVAPSVGNTQKKIELVCAYTTWI